MTKQKLEGVLSKSLKQRKDLWYVKLQVHPLSHTRSPGDFMVLGKERYIIECKQIDMRTNPKNTWIMKRLTQLISLYDFNNCNLNNTGYVLIMFLRKTLKKSDIYLIPIIDYIKKLGLWHKQSVRFDEFDELFNEHKIEVKLGGILNLKTIK